MRSTYHLAARLANLEEGSSSSVNTAKKSWDLIGSAMCHKRLKFLLSGQLQIAWQLWKIRKCETWNQLTCASSVGERQRIQDMLYAAVHMLVNFGKPCLRQEICLLI